MRIRNLVITAVMLVGTAAAVHAGPPWISIEYPSNPHHPSTRGSSLMIHTYHHTQSISSKIDASAVGMVNGRRSTMTLDVRDTSLPGVYALWTPLPRNGVWVLTFTMNQGTALASAVVTVNRSGAIASVTVPSSTTKDGWVVPRAATQADIDAALNAGVVADGGTTRSLARVSRR